MGDHCPGPPQESKWSLWKGLCQVVYIFMPDIKKYLLVYNASIGLLEQKQTRLTAAYRVWSMRYCLRH